MARKRMVTRTVHVRYLTVMRVELATNNVDKITIKTTMTVSDGVKLLEKLNQQDNSDGTYRYLHIVNESAEDIRYAMEEDTFIKLAQPMYAPFAETEAETEE